MFPTVSQLDSFTDVFGDANEVVEENFSQPLSLPTTCGTPESLKNALINGVGTIRPAKHTGQHGEFRSVEEIDPKYRCLFTYPYFNLVQSRIIEDALYSDKSLVVCAPTGSGKTVVFELAILQLLMQMEDAGSTGDFKIIYMAPVKAVCNERLTEWYPKLTRLGLLCIEVTGDTEVDFSQLSPYRVIITTPEKWDMLTRRWRDHRGLVEMIKLFLIDEVHILNDETRGPVLEAVVSRMKTVESAAQSAHRIEQLQLQYQGVEPTAGTSPRIRFVAVSATVSNPEDVADWLGTNEKPAVFHKFGDECRPVKLHRVVEGYPCAEGTSIFKFDLILNYKLWPIIQKYYNGKPTLIFCNTRKSVALTAEALSREVTVSFSPEQKAKLTALASTLKNKKLQMLVMSGVGCHHAGLLYEERINIERAFRNRDLPILITTTTLAMGVNLPAHLVIVKNTQQYVNGAYQEYSMSTVLQMLGRAGRPQFDSRATAVIMTRLQDKPRYQALVGGCEPLQSYLHKRLAENLNSEAALGTVTDVAQCVEWLRSTFLYVRAAKDPKRYLGLPPAAPQQLILKKIEELCVKAMNSLATSGMITMDEASCIESTEAGRLMSLFYMDVGTMKNIMRIDGSETLERLLWLVCESHELSEMHLRMDERRCLNLLNRNNKAATIRFPMKGKINTREMKSNCIIQATLGCLQIPEPALNQEAIKVMRIASRVCKCLVKYVTRPELPPQPQTFSAVLNSIILSKCIEAHLWENSPYVSKQLKGIGATFSTLLASAGITSFMLLEESHPRDLERIMNKGPPAGNIIRKQVSLLPKYQLTVTPIDARSVTIQLMLLNHAHLSENMDQLTAGDSHKSYLVVGDTENNLLLLTQFSDKDFISIYDGTMKYEVTRKLCCKHKILIHCVSSVIVGIDVEADYLFLDLEPPRGYEQDFMAYSNIPKQNIATKQTAITDVYKERKRKNDTDITQCKEKKKREYTITQKLKALKDSFSKTSNTLKTDVDKSMKMSSKVINDLLESKHRHRFPDNNQVSNEVAIVDLTKGIIKDLNGKTALVENSSQKQQESVDCPTVDLTKTMAADRLEESTIHDDDDYIDDSQIDSILSKIESEILGNDPISNKMQGNNVPGNTPTMPSIHFHTKPVPETKPVVLNYRKMTGTLDKSSRSARDSNKRKSLKSNYSFIDLIERKANTDDNITEKNADTIVDSGFSDAIISQINKFLERTQSTTKHTTPVIDTLLDNKMNQELPEIFLKKDPPIETNTHIDDYGQDHSIFSKTNNISVQCQESKSPTILEDNGKYEQRGLNDEYNDLNDLPEVNVKIMPTVEPNQYRENEIHPHDQDLKRSVKETMDYDKMDTCENLRENNMPEERFDFGGTLMNAQPNNSLTQNTITDYTDMPENSAPISNIKCDDSIPRNTLEASSMTELKAEKRYVAKIEKKPGSHLELYDFTKPKEQRTSSNNGLNKFDSLTVINNKIDLQEHDTIDESKQFDQQHCVSPMPFHSNLARNSITSDYNNLVNASNNCDFSQKTNLPVANLLQTVTHPNAETVELAQTSENFVTNLRHSKYELSKIHSYNVGVDERKVIQMNQIDMHELLQESNRPGQSINYSQTAHQNLIRTYNTLKKHSKERESIAYNITPDKNVTMTKPSDCNNALIPCHKAENIKECYGQPPTRLKSYIPYSDRQNVFVQDESNNFLLDKMMNRYQYKNQSEPSCSREHLSNLILTNQIRSTQPTNDLPSRLTNMKYLRGNENLMRDIRQPACFDDTPRIDDTDHTNKQDKFNNKSETYFKRFSYTATKVDVCTKKYAPDHELRITRKLMVDLDVTEIVKHDKTNKTNEGYSADTNEEHDDIRLKSGNITPKLLPTAKNIPLRLEKTNRTNEEYTDNANKDYDDMKLKQNNNTRNRCENTTSVNITETGDINVINTPNLSENTDPRQIEVENVEEQTKYSASNSSIGNILQKYSKILVKPETCAPTIHKIIKKTDNTTCAKTIDNCVPKSRKPFKISDINVTELPLSLNFTNTNKSEFAASQIEPITGTKTETIENQEVFEPKINLTPKANVNPSFESPISVNSLKLDTMEDIKEVFNPRDMKDESMFNPKLLLQYCTEGNEASIIAPPADFSDNAPVYSPASQHTEEFDNAVDQNVGRMEDHFNAAPLESNLHSPKEIETWCLSKDEDYESPVRSAPWVISQPAHTNLGARRPKLCQFKFVRKKPFRP